MPASIPPQQITGLILCGGQARRMGGVDKGLQNFRGAPLALHVLLRLQPQVGTVLINANRNLGAYEGFGVDVWPDAIADYPGPLAGFLTGFEHAQTPFLAVVPCDSPMIPLDLVERLGHALLREQADIAVAAVAEPDGMGGAPVRRQPVFSLLRCDLHESLARFVQGGGRKIDAWTAGHHVVAVEFDDAQAFANVNTADELRKLERAAASPQR
jgi:molybdopterin-guanine dinucleotide biosynthesis protein A